MSKKKLIYYFIAVLVLIAIDQGSKSFLISYLKTQPNYIFELLPILDFVYDWNYGISFGLFREYYQYSNIAFLILNSIIVTYLCYLILKTQACLARLGLISIIGGALGNLIDRMRHGAVFDFIYFHYQDLAFPAFNMADSFITIGACFFIYDYLFYSKK
jgi:signal peptidase II